MFPSTAVSDEGPYVSYRRRLLAIAVPEGVGVLSSGNLNNWGRPSSANWEGGVPCSRPCTMAIHWLARRLRCAASRVAR